MSTVQNFLHNLEVGKGRILVQLFPLAVMLAVVIVLLDHSVWIFPGVYHGLNDAQSMDTAQLARQIERGQGYTTEFIRPYAVAQLQNHAKHNKTGGPTELFPANQFPPNTPRILPDTYNPPLFPYVLAAWFKIVRVDFNQGPGDIAGVHHYNGDLWIPLLNQAIVLLTAVLIAGLAYRLFDARVAWVATLAFLGSGFIWSLSITALSTNLLMLLVTGFFFMALEIYEVGETCFTDEESSFWPAWPWTVGASILLGLACLTSLNLLVLLVPFLVFLALIPRTNLLLLPLVVIIVLGFVGPWFWHMYVISGNPFGSNEPLILSAAGAHGGDHIYRTTEIPSYDRTLKDLSHKEYDGFRWNFERAWDLLGSNPLVLLFAAALLHQFKRGKTQAFRWLVVGSSIVLVLASSLVNPQPEPISSANILPVLMPSMIIVGSAFFLLLLDRIGLQVTVLNTAIITIVLLLTAMPLGMMLIFSPGKYYSYPPYSPPFINLISRMAHPDEWVTSDMPWATAWYGDHASLWLPDTTASFEDFHDEVCPTGMLLFTPVTLGAPVMNLTTGEDKDWISFISGNAVPQNFPLTVHIVAPVGGPEYILWSNVARWQ